MCRLILLIQSNELRNSSAVRREMPDYACSHFCDGGREFSKPEGSTSTRSGFDIDRERTTYQRRVSQQCPSLAQSNDQRAYLYYTSGSSGGTERGRGNPSGRWSIVLCLDVASLSVPEPGEVCSARKNELWP